MKSYEEMIRGLKSAPPVDFNRQYQIIKQRSAQLPHRQLPFVPISLAFAVSAMALLLAVVLNGQLAGEDIMGNYLFGDQTVNGGEIVLYVFTE